MRTPEINWEEDDIRTVMLTDPMYRCRLIRAKETVLCASRGSFKTSMGIAFYLADCVYELEGCTGVICGPSFEHLLDNTINPLFNSLSRHGFVQGVHYVIGTPPPDNWAKPHIKVRAKKYDHIISWHNGSNQFLISQAKKGSANGVSAQYGVIDEVKYIDQDFLKDVVFPAFRGNEVVLNEDGKEVRYMDHSLYLSKFFATDKLADFAKIEWLLEKEKLNDYRKFDIIITLQLELNRLLIDFDQAGEHKRAKLRPQIEAIETRLTLLRKNLTLYIESNASDSIQLLGKDWYDDKVANTDPYEFKIVYENQNPDRPADQFYPDFNKELHTTLEDCYNPNRPLIIALDYQHSVSPMMIAQPRINPDTKKPELCYIDAIHTLAPQGLEEVMLDFCDRYRTHKNRTIYYVYDQTATGKRVNADEYYKIVINALNNMPRWNVVKVHTGKQPGHYQKWVDTKRWLTNTDGTTRITLHAVNCSNAIVSIERSGATGKGGDTKKDKRYEDTATYPKLDQSKTTHFSDVFDMINHAVFKLKRIPITGQNYTASHAMR